MRRLHGPPRLPASLSSPLAPKAQWRPRREAVDYREYRHLVRVSIWGSSTSRNPRQPFLQHLQRLAANRRQIPAAVLVVKGLRAIHPHATTGEAIERYARTVHPHGFLDLPATLANPAFAQDAESWSATVANGAYGVAGHRNLSSQNTRQSLFHPHFSAIAIRISVSVIVFLSLVTPPPPRPHHACLMRRFSGERPDQQPRDKPCD